MNQSSLSSRACAALLCFASGLRQEPAPATGPERQDTGLRRVVPGQEDPEDQRLTQLFARDFDRASWEERLLQEDLERREQSFEDLLKRARLDPVARAFLEDLARAPGGGELAWTARLGLRELGRAHFPMRGFLPGADPRGMGGRMEQMLQEWMSAQMGLHLPHPSAPQSAAPGVQGRVAQHSVRIEQTEKGARVEVQSNLDGELRTRTFEGGSLDEILAQNPELQQELGGVSLRARAGAPIDLRLDLGGSGELFFSGPGERFAPQGRTRPLCTDKLGVLVQKITPEHAAELGLQQQGLYVERSYPETFAHLLGVGSGDVLVELNGQPLVEVNDIERVMRARGADEELTVVWLDELGQRQKRTWRPSPAPKR